MAERPGVNPRLIDYFDLGFTQDDVDFAIPHLKEDIPLYIDPFLFWKSDREDYQYHHSELLAFFERLRQDVLSGRRLKAKSHCWNARRPRRSASDMLLEVRAAPQLGRSWPIQF